VEETMGLCALARAVDIAAIPPERRAVVDLAGKAAWSFVTEHPDAAAAAYRQLLAQYPKEPGVHYAYGLFLLETDIKAALAEFQTEVQSDPQHWPALMVIASLQIRQGAPEKAIETLHGAIKIVPTKYRWLCHLNLGRAALDANKATDAIADLEAAERQVPANVKVHFFLVEAYREAGRQADADREKAEFEKQKAQQDPLGVPALHPFGISK